jgi:hypothetical protein
MRRRPEVLRLVLFCAISITAAALLVRPFALNKEPFDTATFSRMQQRQPEFVLIGDSLLGYAIDPTVLESAIGGRKVETLWYGGAASASWYLYLKNFVAGAAVHPRRVFIFIHDDVLTDAQFRTTGKYAQSLQRLRRGDEPLVRRLTKEDSAARPLLARCIAWLFPADHDRAQYQTKVDGWLRRVVAVKRQAARQLERDANAIFDVPNVRPDQPIVTTEHRKFNESVGESFLPHMLATAREGNYPLCFVRPKKRPGPDAEFDDKLEMREYYAVLTSYLEANGSELIDLTHDPAITADMFSDSVHIGPWATAAFTRHFAERLAERFR